MRKPIWGHDTPDARPLGTPPRPRTAPNLTLDKCEIFLIFTPWQCGITEPADITVTRSQAKLSGSSSQNMAQARRRYPPLAVPADSRLPNRVRRPAVVLAGGGYLPDIPAFTLLSDQELEGLRADCAELERVREEKREIADLRARLAELGGQ